MAFLSDCFSLYHISLSTNIRCYNDNNVVKGTEKAICTLYANADSTYDEGQEIVLECIRVIFIIMA